MFFRQHRIRSIDVVVLQKTTAKRTKNYNARAQLLFSSLSLLFSDVLASVVHGFVKLPNVKYRRRHTRVSQMRRPSRFSLIRDCFFKIEIYAAQATI